jgi:FMN-dependent NADH-azoreductase
MVTSPRKDQSASRALVDAFLGEYMMQAGDIVVDTLDVWQEWLPEFDAETINAKYKGVSGEPMTPAEVTAWEKIRELASRFQTADRVVMGVPMWNLSCPYKLKQLIDLSCQRNMLFTFDGKRYGPSLNIEKAFVAFVRGQSDEVGFETVPAARVPVSERVCRILAAIHRCQGSRDACARTYVGWPCGPYDRRRQKESRRTGKARQEGSGPMPAYGVRREKAAHNEPWAKA